MALLQGAKSTMKWDADLPSGELCSKLAMECHLRLLSWQMLVDLLHMELFAKQLVLPQLSSQKSCKMVPIQSKSVLKHLSEFSEPS